MKRCLLLLVIIAALPACAVGGTASPRSTASPMVSESPERSPEASEPPGDGDRLTGVLGADTIEGGCAYLETPDGTRWQVVYPDGWTIDPSGATLRDPSDAVVATAGDTITVRGREATDMASFCQIGPFFRASEVILP